MRLVNVACFAAIATLSAPASAQDESPGYAAPPDPDSHLSPEPHPVAPTPDQLGAGPDFDASGPRETPLPAR